MEKTRTTIYVSPETWEKFKTLARRDHMKMSCIVEDLILEWVRRKDPGNPQRPLTAWTPGHRDEEARQAQDIFAWLAEYAEERDGWVPYKHIIEVLKETSVPPARRPDLADDLARRLSRAGVKVLR